MSEWESIRNHYAQKPIQLGLERVVDVWKALGGKRPPKVIAVAGTNGKGSCCFMLDSILRSAGYKVGLYTSPHLISFRERICIDGKMASDELLAAKFQRVAFADQADLLTQFELDTLVAVDIMNEACVDVAILEVGLGGRLDAVNVFDADCAVLTSVDFDHMDYLGESLDAIAFEKAGIFRGGRPAICGEPDLPESVIAYAAKIGANLKQIDKDFGYEVLSADRWRFWSQTGQSMILPNPVLQGVYQLGNASVCLAVLEQAGFQVTIDDIRSGLANAAMPGRFQIISEKPEVILDVAHNPHAAKALASNLRGMPCRGRTLAVFGMLADKDIAGVIKAVHSEIDAWFVASIQQPRGASANLLAAILSETASEPVQTFPEVALAFQQAKNSADENDRIIAFGSFYTVADVLRQLS